MDYSDIIIIGKYLSVLLNLKLLKGSGNGCYILIYIFAES